MCGLTFFKPRPCAQIESGLSDLSTSAPCTLLESKNHLASVAEALSGFG